MAAGASIPSIAAAIALLLSINIGASSLNGFGSFAALLTSFLLYAYDIYKKLKHFHVLVSYKYTSIT